MAEHWWHHALTEQPPKYRIGQWLWRAEPWLGCWRPCYFIPMEIAAIETEDTEAGVTYEYTDVHGISEGEGNLCAFRAEAKALCKRLVDAGLV